MEADVLIVEDDKDVRDCMVESLVACGYSVASARHGGEAVEWLTQHPPPRLIMLDWFMPVMTGAEFRAVQRTNPAWKSIPVVVLSASAWRPVPDSDPVDCLRKPVSLQELIQIVNRHAPKR